MNKLDKIHIHTVGKNGNSKTVVIPQSWAELGQKVCIAEKDENTLVISKNVQIIVGGGNSE